MSPEEEEKAEIEYWASMTGSQRIEILGEMQREAWGLKGDERMEKVVVRIAQLDETEDT